MVYCRVRMGKGRASGQRDGQKTGLERPAGRHRRARQHRRRAPRGARLPPHLRRRPAGVERQRCPSQPRTRRRSRRPAPPPSRRERPLGRRPRRRRLRKRLDAGPRGDRARQGRGLRESRQDPARLRRRRRRRRLRLPGPDPDHGGDRLAAERRGLRRQDLARLLRRGRGLPADRRRSPAGSPTDAVKAGAPPVPEQAIEEAKLTKEMLEKEDLVSTGCPRPLRRRRSAATSTSSASSWAPRSRPCAAASPS